MVSVPTAGLTLQVRLVFEVPVMAGVKVMLWPALKVAVPGERLTVTGLLGWGGLDIGFRTKEAVAVLVMSAWLVAISVTFCCAVRVAGAVYTPLFRTPTVGVTDQLTAVLLVPEMEAVNFADWPAFNTVDVGATEIPTGITGTPSDTVAVALLVESARLVAVIATCVSALREDGAV